MSDLTQFRDHCRAEAARTAAPRPKATSWACCPPEGLGVIEDHDGCRWGWQSCACACHDDQRPQPPTESERALWIRLADEIDDYVAGGADDDTAPLWEGHL